MSAPTPRRAGVLWCTAAAATVAFFVLPALLVSLRGFTGEAALVAASESAFVHADLGGRVADSGALAELTARWREFHVVKALIAGVLVLVLAGRTSALRQAVETAERGRRRWSLLGAYGAVVLWLLGALTVLLANAQGAVAPLASVASLLPAEGGPGELRGVLADLRLAVEADSPSRVGGIAGELLGDFTRYHAVLAVLAAGAGVVFMTVALRAVSRRWRQRRTGRSSQPTWVVTATLYGAAGGFFLLLSLANTSTWIDPVPALVATLGGS